MNNLQLLNFWKIVLNFVRKNTIKMHIKYY